MADERKQPFRVLVLGGASSGKSAFAERLAAHLGEPVVYVATAMDADEEMRDRVRKHQERRPVRWRTVEASRDVAEALRRAGVAGGTWLIESVTQLVAASMGDERDVAEPRGSSSESADKSTVAVESKLNAALYQADETNLSSEGSPRQSGDAGSQPDRMTMEQTIESELDLLFAHARASGAGLVFVSDEVGMGVVPDYPSGRRFRDLLGHANQRLSRECDEVYQMVAGLAIECKRRALPWPPGVY